MTRIVTAVRIRRPIDAVFAYATTPGNWPAWHPASISVEGGDHPCLVDEEAVEEFVAAGRHGRTTWRVTRREAPHRWRIETESREARAAVEYRLRAEDGGTLFERELSYRVSGAWLALLDLLLLRRRMDRESRLALENLKAVLEAPVPQGSDRRPEAAPAP